MKKEAISFIKEILVLLVATFCYAISMYCFVLRANFTNGGIAGIVTMVCYLIKTDNYAGVLNLLINAPLLILAFITLDRRYAIKTIISSLLISAFLSILPLLPFNIQFDPQVMLGDVVYTDIGRSILSTLFGGVFAGVAIALVIRVNASTGGVDIVAMFIQRKNPACPVHWGIFIVNCLVIGVSIIVYSYDVNTGVFSFGTDSLQPVMLALIYQFVSAKVSDIMIEGVKVAFKFEVVTDYPEELAQELITTLKHGVTLVPAKGMFEHKDRNLIICIVKKRQIQAFKDILKKYPGTFAYVASVKEIIGIFNK